MFEVTSRFMTRRIQEEVPLEVQLLIWYELDGQLNAGLKMDYLQIFIFEKIGEDVFLIKHEQEQPQRLTYTYCNYKNEYEKLLDTTIYIIDDGDHSTMLFASEY